jgi:hypothetical protein
MPSPLGIIGLLLTLLGLAFAFERPRLAVLSYFKSNRLLEALLTAGGVIQAASSSGWSPCRAGATFQGRSSSMRLIG